MAVTLAKAGIADTTEENAKIIEHLLEVGEKVKAGSNVDVASEIVGPNGAVKMLTTWKILPDGNAYLSTIKLIPKM